MGNVAETEITANSNSELDKEISDVLIAISVITRQLAKKIAVKHMSKEEAVNEEHRDCSFI